MPTYKINYTRISKTPISVPESDIDTSTAMKLFGRKRLSYGKDLNENFLRLLESLACPQDFGDGGGPEGPHPDLSVAAEPHIFENPVEGQLWFNSTPTKEALYCFNGEVWVPQSKLGEVAANWGVIADGGQIPLPVSPTGATYQYHECAWIVSPYGYPNSIDYMQCFTSASANVTMQYSLESSPDVVGGFANYIIIGIRGNNNLGTLPPIGE